MKEFEFFLKSGDVKTQKPDENLSKSAFKDSVERLELSKSILQKAKPKYILENAYEAMREAADSILYLEGYKSYSHEASIVYLAKKGFQEKDLIEFNRFRKIRNGIKYYGKNCDESDSELCIKLAEKIINRIKEILESIAKKTKPFNWKTKDSEIEINSLKELLNISVSIKQEGIDKEFNLNKDNLIEWLEQNFPKELDLITSIKDSLKELTPQQIRELIVRKLRKIT